MEILEKHEKFLYPVVRVLGKTKGANNVKDDCAGTGTIVYSKPSKKGILSLVLTCNHVIAGLIDVKREWDEVMKMFRDKEYMEIANVETFSYVNGSEVNSVNKYRAEIVAYETKADLAILKIDSPYLFPYVTPIIPKEKIGEIQVLDEVIICGCSLGHDPLLARGIVNYLHQIEDGIKFLMSDAAIIFGHSGGAIFRENGELIAIPAQVGGVYRWGFNIDINEHMGHCIHPDEIYKFIDKQEFRFLYDDADTFEDALERRKAKEREALLQLKAEAMKDIK